ncbi:TetR/AcrR family transcriptional regulator [Nocardioides sp. GY 10113]|uniref:TetR/AcrR family transcriptional regulator n=1 Tax=Nocardioides sp. GY 10113 TaxID=2569761 RepID=UPI0010A7C1DC|nr:TetR/AcrR family transcriptional regulator [Nocardioides sp. GY 10113]TIC83923.1 TetR/AcrR family transcriptional regulator [Nocardioides sp. GY 10113]
MTGKPDGRQARWDEHNRARRRAIIDAAIGALESHRPGEEVQLQAVAEAAGMARTVVYRHFDDRADLDRAVQKAVFARIGEELVPALAIDTTPKQMTERVVGAFVHWSVAHPSLIWFAGRDLSGGGPSPMNVAIENLASGIEAVMEHVVAAAGAYLGPDDRAALDPWVFGMVSGVFASVRRWLARDERRPATDAFAAILAESFYSQLTTLASSRGIDLDAIPVSELVKPLGGGAR